MAALEIMPSIWGFKTNTIKHLEKKFSDIFVWMQARVMQLGVRVFLAG
jgi:hypothetical protein